MKTVAAAILSLLVLGTASKVKHNLRQAAIDTAAKRSTPALVCPEGMTNRLPASLEDDATDGKFNLLGKVQAAGDNVFDLTKLRDALGADPDWKAGTMWHLQMLVENGGPNPKTFAFAGGGGPNGGFLTITIPANHTDTLIVEDTVKTKEAPSFQYRGPALFTDKQVSLSAICLAPKVCKNFECPNPSTNPDMFKAKSPDTVGWSVAKCCERRMCAAEAVECAPDSEWVKKSDYDTRPGSSKQECCKKTLCPENICANSTKWQPSNSTGLAGNTPEECCLKRECPDWSCAGLWQAKNQAEGDEPLQGWSDAECCDKILCNVFHLPKQLKTVYKFKDGYETLQGNTLSECCEPLMCKDFECPNNTLWMPPAKDIGKTGSTIKECCEPKWCSTYDCSSSGGNSKTNLQPLPSPETLQGQTDEECCELKFCTDYNCSDYSKWIHQSDLSGQTKLERRGASDEECCEKLFCNEEVCSSEANPPTKWKPKADIEKIQGNTANQCCDQILCEGYTCNTDDDGDGDGTAWYKRMDTNTYKWQGSSDEECCLPKFCSQYTTTFPTKWKRKKQRDVLGSTDAECYDQRWCIHYCCEGDFMILKPGADKRPGSTDGECCMDRRPLLMQNKSSPVALEAAD